MSDLWVNLGFQSHVLVFVLSVLVCADADAGGENNDFFARPKEQSLTLLTALRAD